MGFCVTAEEKAMIYKRMGQTKISNLRAYLLKMAVDGRVIHIDLTNVNECARLLRNISNNINQIAKKAHEMGSIHVADMGEIKTRQDEIWRQQEVIIKSLAKVLGVV